MSDSAHHTGNRVASTGTSMRELVSTLHADYALSVRVALDAAGIRYWMNDPTGYEQTRIFVFDEADYERARALIRDIDVSDIAPDGPFTRRFLRAAALVFVVIMAAGVILMFLNGLRG